jgi:hypothetical protein
VEADAVRSQPAKTLLDLSPKRLRPTFSGSESPFRRHDVPIRNSRESVADRLFAASSGVGMGGVDVADSGGDGLFHEANVPPACS